MLHGVLIQRVSRSDKEFHFQNWVRARLDDAGLQHDSRGRNSYPDFTLVHHQEGYEVKGLKVGLFTDAAAALAKSGAVPASA